MMNDSQTWLLMSRLLAGEASPEEKEELQRLLRQYPEKEYLFDILHSYFKAPSPNRDSIASDTIDAGKRQQQLQRILHLAEPGTSTPGEVLPEDQPERKAKVFSLPLRRIIGYAAAAVLTGVVIAALFWRQHRPVPAQEKGPVQKGGEIIARAGARTRLVLPDGTLVFLNSNSRLKYAAGFNQMSREVELEGEACFDVAKDAQRPFVVHVSDLSVRVLGTVFNLKSYPQDITVEATLLKGSIEVSRKDNKNAPRVILRPNEKLVFNKELSSEDADRDADEDSVMTGNRHAPVVMPDFSINALPKNIPDSNKEETAWMYNRLVFDGDSFKELAEKMERWFNVKIVFRDEVVSEYRFGGVFAGEPVEKALQELKISRPFNYTINGNLIEISKK